MYDLTHFNLLRKIPVDSSWFEVYQLDHAVYAITEPYHFQFVISYLIEGSDRALLIDTGMNIAAIGPIVSQLCNKPVEVVNTHVHFDHVGNNFCFPEVSIFGLPAVMDRLKRGYSAAEMKPQIMEKLFYPAPPPSFDPENYCIPGCNPKGIADGHRFELGDRTIEVIHTPGHSPESIMLLDQKNGMLFTGDTYYPGALYAHFDGPMYGKSDIPDYARSMKKICALIPELKTIHPSHNFPVEPPSKLAELEDALAAIVEHRAECQALTQEQLSLASLPDDGESVEGYVVSDNLCNYLFNGFSIIAERQE